MQDQEVVAAIVAGDPDGIAEAYDRYAAPLYAYCSLALPGPDTADVVRDTFLIATWRLEGLRDPGKLGSWLHAVVRSECLRRRSAAGVTSPPPKMPRSASGDDALPAVELPAGLRGQVLKACTDSTPTGRADRASTAHRAGAFGPTGFPKAPGSPGPPWRQLGRQLRRRRRAAAAVATVAAAGATAGIIVMLTVGGSHRAQASTLAKGGGISGGSPVAAGRASASPSPGHQASPATRHPAPSGTALKGTVSPGSSTRHGTPRASASASGTSSSPTSASPTSASPTASPSPTPSSSPSASPTPTPGILKVAPDTLVLTSTGGKAASGKFILSAVGGPVKHYVIKVPAGMGGKLTVTPATGSLADGGSVTVRVTVTSKIALHTHVTVDPGGLTVTVQLGIKA